MLKLAAFGMMNRLTAQAHRLPHVNPTMADSAMDSNEQVHKSSTFNSFVIPRSK